MTADVVLPLVRGFYALLAVIVLRFLYKAYIERRRVRTLKAQGIVSSITYQKEQQDTKLIHLSPYYHIRYYSAIFPSSQPFKRLILQMLIYMNSILGSLQMSINTSLAIRDCRRWFIWTFGPCQGLLYLYLTPWLRLSARRSRVSPRTRFSPNTCSR